MLLAVWQNLRASFAWHDAVQDSAYRLLANRGSRSRAGRSPSTSKPEGTVRDNRTDTSAIVRATLSLKVVAQYLGGLITAAFFVALLSFIFSFLGNIFCAALAGMMLGALRSPKGLSCAVSLMLPLVLLSLFWGMKTELDARQVLVLCAASFCTFWLTYLAAAMLFVLERRPTPPTGPTQSPIQVASGPDAQSSTDVVAGVEIPAQASNRLAGLQLLQGDWLPGASATAQLQNQRVHIQNEELTLSVTDPGGQVRILVRAQIKPCLTDSPSTLPGPQPETEPRPDRSAST